jgi:hypothetical protein
MQKGLPSAAAEGGVARPGLTWQSIPWRLPTIVPERKRA